MVRWCLLQASAAHSDNTYMHAYIYANGRGHAFISRYRLLCGLHSSACCAYVWRQRRTPVDIFGVFEWNAHGFHDLKCRIHFFFFFFIFRHLYELPLRSSINIHNNSTAWLSIEMHESQQRNSSIPIQCTAHRAHSTVVEVRLSIFFRTNHSELSFNTADNCCCFRYQSQYAVEFSLPSVDANLSNSIVKENKHKNKKYIKKYSLRGREIIICICKWPKRFFACDSGIRQKYVLLTICTSVLLVDASILFFFIFSFHSFMWR